MYFDIKGGGVDPRANPLKAVVAPRPIGWISTVGADGVGNLAPYSFFNVIADTPPLVMFSSDRPKDSRRNAEDTGEFVVNLATYDLRHAMNETSRNYEKTIDEAEAAELEMVSCVAVRPRRVKLSPVAIECRYVMTIPLRAADGTPSQSAIVVGEVLGIFIDDSLITEGQRVDVSLAKPILRMGYSEYGMIGERFDLKRP